MRTKKITTLILSGGLLTFMSGWLSACQVIDAVRSTPIPLVTNTSQIRLDQVAEMPTLPPITPTPTISAERRVSYQGEVNLFDTVSEILPLKPLQQVTLLGELEVGEVLEKEIPEEEQDPELYIYYYSTLPKEEYQTFTLKHSSGTHFKIECDDFCFITDQAKHLVSRETLEKTQYVMVYGTCLQNMGIIRADLIVVKGKQTRHQPHPKADMSELPSPYFYREFKLSQAPQLSPLSVQDAPTPEPTETPEDYIPPYLGYDADRYYYDPYWGYYPKETEDPTWNINDRIENRLLHTLEEVRDFNLGLYGETYETELNYTTESNRSPEYPTRANISLTSNYYEFFNFWFPHVETPMTAKYGILVYKGDWYVPIRMSVDLNPDPNVADIVYCDRTMTNNNTLEKQKGYLRTFGFSILNRRLFYFYEKEDGFGFSLDGEDYDLDFDEVPYGLLTPYNYLNPFFADDQISFFGLRDGEWFYTEINSPQPKAY